MIRITMILTVFTVLVVSGCTNYPLPAVGMVIYCPSCDSDLYLREQGTSRTKFRREDYRQIRFDIPVPKPTEQTICPICHASIVERDSEGNLLRVYYRDQSYWRVVPAAYR